MVRVASLQDHKWQIIEADFCSDAFSLAGSLSFIWDGPWTDRLTTKEGEKSNAGSQNTIRSCTFFNVTEYYMIFTNIIVLLYSTADEIL